jgi:hypothetical protein
VERQLRGGVEQAPETREMRHVADEREVAIGGRELIAHPFRRIFGLEPAHHPERRERRADAQHGFAGLSRAELPAVPDFCRHQAGGLDPGRGHRGLLVPTCGQRALRINVWPDRVRVVDENNTHDIV